VNVLSSDSDLDDIRRKRMQELRRQLADEQTQARQQVEVQQEKQAVLRQILTSEARDRLGRIRLVKPEFVDQLELQLIQAAQGGRLKLPITDAQLKELLSKLQTQRRGINMRGV
jgi:programmed cell death protein 5